jgi:hypothetical protein
MTTLLIFYFGGHYICSSKTQKEIIFHLHDNDCYEKAPQWHVTHILLIVLHFHVKLEVIKVMDVAWFIHSLSSHGRVSVSIPGQIGVLVEKLVFYADCGGEFGILVWLWCRNFHGTEVFLEKFPFYRGFGGEIGILHGLCWRNWHFNGVLVQKFPLYRCICRGIGILQGFWLRTCHFNGALVQKFL